MARGPPKRQRRSGGPRKKCMEGAAQPLHVWKAGGSRDPLRGGSMEWVDTPANGQRPHSAPASPHDSAVPGQQRRTASARRVAAVCQSAARSWTLSDAGLWVGPFRRPGAASVRPVRLSACCAHLPPLRLAPPPPMRVAAESGLSGTALNSWRLGAAAAGRRARARCSAGQTMHQATRAGATPLCSRASGEPPLPSSPTGSGACRVRA